MSKMIIMRGLPASGKSTRAKEFVNQGNTVRINKDLLRTMLHFDKFNHINEDATRQAARELASTFLAAGKVVVIDDTNLNPKTLQSWVDLAKSCDAKIQHESMYDVSVDECVKRDKLRPSPVGEHVIKQMALQYQNYLANEKVVICDLDGTLCDITHRLKYVQGVEKKDWQTFFALLHHDRLREDVWKMVSGTSNTNNAKIIFVSARPEEYRKQTIDWIFTHVPKPNFELLIMRSEGDKREDVIVKSEIYEKYLKNLDIVRVFDDRPSVIRMWREKGLTVEDVGAGVEF